MQLHTVLCLALVATLGSAQEVSGGIRCSRIMCTMFCEVGFKTDSLGCEFCECLPDPCVRPVEMQICPADTMCLPGNCTSHPCTQVAAVCKGMPMCAEPMCANFCPNGYTMNEMGCMTCKCKDTCDELPCASGTVCRTLEEGVSKCIPKPLCHRMQESASLLAGPAARHTHAPECEELGDFKPMQCSGPDVAEEERKCWCVDDRGQEMPGTSRPSNLLGDEGRCEKTKTQKVHIEMTIVHEFIHIEEHLEGLDSTLKTHISKWLMVDEEMVTIVEITPQQEIVKAVYVHVTVVSGGNVDLPSSLYHMRQQMRTNNCQIPYHNKYIHPNEASLQVSHEYSAPSTSAQPKVSHEFSAPSTSAQPKVETPEVPECFGEVNGKHKMAFIFSNVGILIILICIVAVCTLIVKMKRRTYQFRHKRLESMETFKKNLVLSSDMQTPDVVLEDEKKEVPTDFVSVDLRA